MTPKTFFCNYFALSLSLSSISKWKIHLYDLRVETKKIQKERRENGKIKQ
jgi:hypothetical protein